MSELHRHGGPYDRGSKDRYYGRAFRPHYYTAATQFSPRVEIDNMTDVEKQEYRDGWDEETDEKDWGDDEY